MFFNSIKEMTSRNSRRWKGGDEDPQRGEEMGKNSKNKLFKKQNYALGIFALDPGIKLVWLQTLPSRLYIYIYMEYLQGFVSPWSSCLRS